MDLKRTIIILMVLACIIDVIGVIHCHITFPYNAPLTIYHVTYCIIFPILLSLTSLLLIEQLTTADGTIAPLNRLRTFYACAAAILLLIFGVGTAIISSRTYDSSSSQDPYNHSVVIASVVAFVGMTVYFAEALARNRKGSTV